MHARKIIGLVLAIGLLTTAASAAYGTDAPDPQQTAMDRTPPRLSYVDAHVSFWRPGAEEWTQAQVNTALAPGDQLSTGSPGNLEVQIGARAFVRAGANSQIGLENQEPDYLQIKVTAGQASFDLRALEPGHTVEVDTPNAAFTIEHPGYYRVGVTGDRTLFITRRAGRATVTPANGEAVVIAPSEEVVIEGSASPQVSSFVAPPLDAWDRWNYARTDALLDAVSARYVSPGTYGVDDLDQHGTWRVVPTYGPVWVPRAVPTGWAPYTTGAWMLDPYYGWTWVDTAPWGWAPYHYGRWVFVNGFWGWAPGPVVVRPVYAPALVAFFGGPNVSVSIGIGGPVVGWVALGWGEPCVPWWGRPGFIHRPWWGGWGGPRIVNNTVISHTTVVTVQNISVYRNTSVRNAVVVVNEPHFGRGPITRARVTRVDVKSLQPIHTAPKVTATPASFVPTAKRGIRPPEASLNRSVVATRPPHPRAESASREERNVGPAGVPAPAPRLVTAPTRREPASVPPRPQFGKSTVERPMSDRPRPPAAPRREGPPQPEKGPVGAPPVGRPAPAQPRPEAKLASPSPAASQPPVAGATAPPPSPRRPQATSRPSDRVQPPSPRKIESPRVPEKGPVGAPPVGRPAPVQPRPEAKLASPSPAAPQPPAAGATTPRPSARRPEASRPPAQQLPGEPANRLSPNRGGVRPPEHPDRKKSPAGPNGAPGAPSKDRPRG